MRCSPMPSRPVYSATQEWWQYGVFTMGMVHRNIIACHAVYDRLRDAEAKALSLKTEEGITICVMKQAVIRMVHHSAEEAEEDFFRANQHGHFDYDVDAKSDYVELIRKERD